LSVAPNRTHFIHPFDDEAVIAGQGTIGLEMMEQESGLDAVIIPIGGGGLIAGLPAPSRKPILGFR